MKHNIRQLYYLRPDIPTAMACWVDYLLEPDRFMCPPHGYEVSPTHWTSADMSNDGKNVGLTHLVPCRPDCGGSIRQVFRQNPNGRDAGPKLPKCIKYPMVCPTCAILCHSIRASQTELCKNPPKFNAEIVGGDRVRNNPCFLIAVSPNGEKCKIFLSGRRTHDKGSPGGGRTCLY